MWEDNIKVDLKELWWEGMVWNYLAQDRDHWQVLGNEPLCSLKVRQSLNLPSDGPPPPI
jgi:hypothetical protein